MAALRNAANSFSENAMLARELECIARVTATSPTQGSIVKHGQQSIHEIGIQEFKDSGSVQELLLLCEDYDDGIIYQLLARCYLRSKMSRKLRPKLKIHGAGGANLYKATEFELKNKRRLALAIADGDLGDSDRKDGNTSDGLGSLSQEFEAWLGVYITQIREIENLAPPSVIIAAGCKSGLKPQGEFIASIISDTSIDYWKFIDIKEGTKLCDPILRKPEIARTLGNLSTKHPNVFDMTCRCTSSPPPKKCRCRAFKGLGGTAAVEFRLYLDRACGRPHIEGEFNDDQWNMIEKLSRTIIAWACAKGPIL